MVIELSDLLINNTSLNKEYKPCISNLLLGYYEGNHMLMASEDLCDFLLEAMDNPKDKSIINYLKNHSSFIYNVECRIIVVLNDALSTENQVNLSFFKKTKSIQPTVLVGENMNDAYFFYYITKCIFKEKSILFQADGGGGSSTIDKLKRFTNDNDVIALFITDSDHKYPGCQDGGTYKTLNSNYNNSKPIIRLEKLKVHEIENLVPFNFMLNNAKDNGKQFLKKIKDYNLINEILLFYDIKNGIKKIKITGDKEYYSFAADIYNKIRKKNEAATFDKFVQRFNDNQSVFPAIHSKMCEKYLEHVMDIKSFLIKVIDKPDSKYLASEWERLANLVYSYCCGRTDDPIQ